MSGFSIWRGDFPRHRFSELGGIAHGIFRHQVGLPCAVLRAPCRVPCLPQGRLAAAGATLHRQGGGRAG